MILELPLLRQEDYKSYMTLPFSQKPYLEMIKTHTLKPFSFII